MMHSIKIVLITSLYFFSRYSDKESKLAIIEHPFPTIIGNLKLIKNNYLDNIEEGTWLRTANYSFLYNGKLRDTITVNRELNYQFQSSHLLLT